MVLLHGPELWALGDAMSKALWRLVGLLDQVALPSSRREVGTSTSCASNRPGRVETDGGVHPLQVSHT